MKKKTFQSNAALLVYFLKGSFGVFLCSILSAGIVSVMDLINPKIIEYTVDSVIGTQPLDASAPVRSFVGRIGGVSYLREHIYLVAVMVAGVALVGAVFRYLSQLWNSMGSERLVKRMRDCLYTHLMELPVSWFEKYSTGDIIQRSTSDVETVKVFVSEQLTQLFRVVLLIVFSMYFMIRINWKLALAEGFFIPVMIVGSIFFYTKIGRAFHKVDTEEGKLSAIAQENLTGVRVVRAFGREDYERKRFKKQNDHYTQLWYSLQKVLAGFWVAGNVVATTRNLTVVLLGVVFCVTGELTAGGLIAFISYNALISLPVRRLGRIITEMGKAGISIGRIREIMNGEAEADGAGALEPPINQDVSFEHVSYRYPDSGGEILEDIDFQIPAGSTLGILGSTGSGKSTLMYLLDRIYELPEGNGEIRIGAADIRKIRRKWLRGHIGMVLQEPYLFSGTLSDNISIAAERADMHEIRDAARISSLEDTIKNFTHGYDTHVGERGITLSGGQKQRAAIAQMLVRRPDIMIFDDSLSAVDAETDARIRASIRENIHGTTTILISHRISTLQEADQIIVLEKGRIAERGTHEELIRKDGIYRRIYELQTQE